MTGPKRHESGEMPTVAVPRHELPPPSAGFLGDLEHDEETKVPCPLCASCGACRGTHLVTASFAAALVEEGEG